MQHEKFETINISIEGKEIDYSLARRLSEDIVSTIIDEPMLIACFFIPHSNLGQLNCGIN